MDAPSLSTSLPPETTQEVVVELWDAALRLELGSLVSELGAGQG